MQHKYVPQIDTLRALAVVSVIAYHLNPSLLPGGFTGVDIFFVISGYVVSASLSNIERLSFKNFITTFYAKRLLRILPALIVCLTFIAVATTLFIPRSWLGGSTTQTIVLAFFGLSNLTLMNTGDSYFAPRTDFNPATHTWSLGVEEQFYFLLPLLYYFTLNKSKGNHSIRFTSFLLPALVVASFIYCFYISSFASPKAYYSIFSRFWELGLGVILFILHDRGIRFPIFGKHPLSAAITGILLILISLLFSSKEHFPFPWAIPSTFGALLLIEAVTSRIATNTPWLATLSQWPGPAIGKRSYSLYLWHWPIFVIFRWTCGLDSLITQVLAIILTLAASELSYRYIESATRNNAKLVGLKSFKLVMAMLLACFMAAAVSVVVILLQPKLSLSVTSNIREWTSDASDVIGTTDLNGCKLTHSEAPMTSGFSISYKHADCDRKLESPRLFIIGDSHATALNRFAALYAKEKGSDVYIYSKLGCSFLNLYETTKPECQDFFADATETLLKNARPNDQVLLASLRLRRLSDQWTRFDVPEVVGRSTSSFASQARERAATEASVWLDRFRKSDLRIIFLAPPPVFGSPAFRCSDWFNQANSICEGLLTSNRDFQSSYREPVVKAMSELESIHGHLSVFDPFLRFCPESECSMKSNGKILFFDGDHLSGYGNEVLLDEFKKFIALGVQTKAKVGGPQ